MLSEKAKNNNRLIFYYAGNVLHNLKQHCKHQKEFKKLLCVENFHICNSISYAYKLIYFYKTCLIYTNLRYTTLSIKIILENLGDLKRLMENDKAFWTNNDDNADFEINDQYIEDDYMNIE